VVPVKDSAGRIVGVLDIDSKDLSSFDEADAQELEKIVALIYAGL
jgi:GAF domain-containing protein